MFFLLTNYAFTLINFSTTTKISARANDFQGVAIQPKMLNASCQLFLGSRKDPKFGSIICLGTGGNLIEKDRELSVGFPPLNQVLARQIMENTKALQYCKDACAREV